MPSATLISASPFLWTNFNRLLTVIIGDSLSFFLRFLRLSIRRSFASNSPTLAFTLSIRKVDATHPYVRRSRLCIAMYYVDRTTALHSMRYCTPTTHNLIALFPCLFPTVSIPLLLVQLQYNHTSSRTRLGDIIVSAEEGTGLVSRYLIMCNSIVLSFSYLLSIGAYSRDIWENSR